MNIDSLPQSPNGQNPTDGISAGKDSQLKAVAEQFEALFLQQVLKQMRKAGDVLAAENSMRSRESNTMRGFYDDMMAETLAGKNQMGIADLLVKQLGGGEEGADLASAETAAQKAPLPQRTASLADPLRSTWQRNIE